MAKVLRNDETVVIILDDTHPAFIDILNAPENFDLDINVVKKKRAGRKSDCDRCFRVSYDKRADASKLVYRDGSWKKPLIHIGVIEKGSEDKVQDIINKLSKNHGLLNNLKKFEKYLKIKNRDEWIQRIKNNLKIKK